ncbi:MAG: undecaprenyl-phosphate glucose phosphotransferase [Pseudomonadota bacterium]
MAHSNVAKSSADAHADSAVSGSVSAAPVGQARKGTWSLRVANDIIRASEVVFVAVGIIVPATLFATWATPVADPGVIAQTGLIAALLYHLLERDTVNGPLLPQPLTGLGASDAVVRLSVVFLASLGLGIPLAAYGAHLLAWYALWLSATLCLILVLRAGAGAYVRQRVAQGWFNKRVAIYGAGEIAQRAYAFIGKGESGFELVGIYDDRSDEARAPVGNVPISGSLETMIADGRSGHFDAVIIALPASADQRISRIAARLEQLATSLHVVTHLADDLIVNAPRNDVSSIGPVGLMDVKPHPHADWAPMIKRLEDLVIGLALLVPALPVMAVIALAIRLDSPGPILFRQRRRGYNHSTFACMKFRTMTVLEDGTDVRQAQADDQRITRVGRWLRRSSLDELPQLFNVIAGDMSIVGPRPHAVAHDTHWGELVPRYVNRNQVKPGITGLAQVNGARGEIAARDDLDKRIEADLTYVANWSLWLDLTLIARTVVAVLRARNAH